MAVAVLNLEIAQLPELVAPFRVKKKIIIISGFKLRRIETWLVFMLALAIIRSLIMRLVFGLLFVTLAHCECLVMPMCDIDEEE